MSYFSHYTKVNGLQMPHHSAFWLTLRGAPISRLAVSWWLIKSLLLSQVQVTHAFSHYCIPILCELSHSTWASIVHKSDSFLVSTRNLLTLCTLICTKVSLFHSPYTILKTSPLSFVKSFYLQSIANKYHISRARIFSEYNFHPLMMPLLNFILLYSIEKGTSSASVSAESTKTE